MSHKKYATYSNRKKGHHKGESYVLPTVKGAAKPKRPKRYPTLKAAEAAARKLSRRSNIKGKSERQHKKRMSKKK